jgi:hypothetical protein
VELKVRKEQEDGESSMMRIILGRWTGHKESVGGITTLKGLVGGSEEDRPRGRPKCRWTG